MKIFLKRLWRPGFSAEQNRILSRIRVRVEQWVLDKGYLKPLTCIDDIAEDIGVPADQLSLYLKLKAHQSLLSWRKELRILDARRLLLEYPDLSVAAIGEMVGVDDKSNFKRQFCDVVGMSPREWRELHQKK